jgi:hypothetical protein
MVCWIGRQGDPRDAVEGNDFGLQLFALAGQFKGLIGAKDESAGEVRREEAVEGWE